MIQILETCDSTNIFILSCCRDGSHLKPFPIAFRFFFLLHWFGFLLLFLWVDYPFSCISVFSSPSPFSMYICLEKRKSCCRVPPLSFIVQLGRQTMLLKVGINNQQLYPRWSFGGRWKRSKKGVGEWVFFFALPLVLYSSSCVSFSSGLRKAISHFKHYLI